MDHVQQAAEEEAIGQAERLRAAERQKMALLQHDLSHHMVEIDAIESFINQVLSYAADPTNSPSVPSAAAQALRLVEHEHELMASAQRMLVKPVVPAVALSADDLPNEVLERRERLSRLESLEQLMTVKDAMLRAVISDGAAKEEQLEEQAAYARRAHAFATTLQSKAHDEVTQWASVADDYALRVDGLQAALAASQHEADQLRMQNDALREQNEQLRAHCTELREVVVQSGIGLMS